jgi:hypothetical protein
VGRLKHLGRKTNECIFCDARADSKEHVWPEWILTRFRVPNSGVMGTVADDSYLDRNQKALRLRCVCVRCNTGWMKTLEDEAMPLLSSLAQDIAMSLSEEQQRLAAVWATKMAMVWEHFSSENRRLFYLKGHREELRAKHQIPENTEIWLARYGGPRLLFCAARDMTDDLALPNADTTFRAVSTEVVFGWLGVQVLSYRSLMTHRIARMPDPKPPLQQCVVRVWPQERVARWPPRLTVGQEIEFEMFQKRWGIGSTRV